MREKRRDAADGARLSLDVVEREVAFGRRIEFENLRDRKPRLKILPDVAAQAVAANQTQPVPRLEFRHGRLEKITAELADILEQRAVPADDVTPERAGGKLVGDHDRG